MKSLLFVLNFEGNMQVHLSQLKMDLKLMKPVGYLR